MKIKNVILGFALFGSGCGAPKTVNGDAVFSALTTVAATIQSANGTYTNCLKHTDGDMWSVSADGHTPLDFPKVSIVEMDPSCALTITQLHTDTGIKTTTNGIFLNTNSYYDSNIHSFGTNLYANAMYTGNWDGTFDKDFTIFIIYGDTAQSVSTTTASYQTITGSAIAMAVPAPDYVLGFSATMSIQTDAYNTVVSTTGYVYVDVGSIPATDEPRIADGLVPNDYASAVASWAIASPTDDDTIDGNGHRMVKLFLDSFVGKALPATETLIFINTDFDPSLNGSNVSSYETLALTINPAP